MASERGYLIVLLLLCIPLGLFLGQIWARSRSPGVVRLDQETSEAEPVPEAALLQEVQPEPQPASSDKPVG